MCRFFTGIFRYAAFTATNGNVTTNKTATYTAIMVNIVTAFGSFARVLRNVFWIMKSFKWSSKTYQMLVSFKNFCQQVTTSKRTTLRDSAKQAGQLMYVGCFCRKPIFFKSIGFIRGCGGSGKIISIHLSSSTATMAAIELLNMIWFFK